MFLEISQNSQENTCARVSSTSSKKETMVQVLSCEFWEIFNNSFFTEHLRATASGFGKPCLNSDLYFYIQNLWYSFIRDNSFLQTPSQSLTGKQNSSLSTSRHINNITALMCIFFSFLSFSCANQNNSIINGWKYRSKWLLIFFCHQKSNKKADKLCMKFSSASNISSPN